MRQIEEEDGREGHLHPKAEDVQESLSLAHLLSGCAIVQVCSAKQLPRQGDRRQASSEETIET